MDVVAQPKIYTKYRRILPTAHVLNVEGTVRQQGGLTRAELTPIFDEVAVG